MKLWPLTLLICVISFTVLASPPRIIEKTETWRGEVVLTAPVTIAASGELLIQPGTRVLFGGTGELIVQGKLTALGEAGREIHFTAAPKKTGFLSRFWPNKVEATSWAGLTLNKGEAAIHHAVISKAATGITAANAALTLVRVRLEDNQTGLFLKQRSNALIKECAISNNQTGVSCAQESAPEIVNNTFTGNKTALLCLQAAPKQITANQFVANEVGLVCRYPVLNLTISNNLFRANHEVALSVSQGAAPLITQNQFQDNALALKAEKRALPRISQNNFTNNVTALYLNQGAAAVVTYNNFTGSSQRALFVNNSSYPLINYNNFSQNHLDVELGDHQSTAYELALRGGSVKRTEEAESRKKAAPRRLPSTSALETLAGFVDARYNYWSENQNLVSNGETLNLPNVIDYFDVPSRRYDNGQDYVQDKVETTPTAERRIDIDKI